MEGQTKAIDGWIFGRLTAIETRCANPTGPECQVPLRAKPEMGAKTVASVPAETQVAVIGCSGDFVEVEAALKAKKPVKGWLEPEAQCANPVTTCP